MTSNEISQENMEQHENKKAVAWLTLGHGMAASVVPIFATIKGKIGLIKPE